MSKSLTPPPSFERTSALADPSDRISREFSVPKQLKRRTAFWFDIYTYYGGEQHVIHHTLYPWVIYKVVDTRPISNSNLHKWTKYHKAQRLVKSERREIQQALKRLSRRKSYKNLKPLERQLFTALRQVHGSRKKVFSEAAQNVRVQLGQKDFFLSGLSSSANYLPIIESVFLDKGLPTELARLPFVESSFNIHAESKVGASGIWQIMPATGKSFLLVTDHIDERNSPLKASLAAAEIFHRNYKSLKSWPLAITAYNHGVSGVKKSLKMARANNLPDLIDRYHDGAFRFASANFYTSFLAALHAEKYHAEIFEGLRELERAPLEHQVVALKKPLRFKKLLTATGLDAQTLLEYNLDLKNAARNNAFLPSGFRLILPPQSHPSLKFEAVKRSSLLKEAQLQLKPKTKASG